MLTLGWYACFFLIHEAIRKDVECSKHDGIKWNLLSGNPTAAKEPLAQEQWAVGFPFTSPRSSFGSQPKYLSPPCITSAQQL